MWNDTIVAISTALQTGAISIIRISGEDSFEYIQKISDIKPEKIKANTIHYAHLYDNEIMIDEVLISFFKAPHSYTGEDMVEINAHGSIYNTRRILNLLLAMGCRLAEPGEFTRKAYLSGRIDLSEAEAVNELVNANTYTQAQYAINSLKGAANRLLEPLLKEMADILSMIEVNIDYPEYEDEKQMTQNNILPEVDKWLEKLDKMIQDGQDFSLVKNGIKTAIIGKPNVGKSSLLNALLDREKAIVTDVAGTTRDLIEDVISFGNINLHLIDTAGIRESDDIVEKIGIERSINALEEADLVLLVLDASKPLDEEDETLLELSKDKERIIVYNKTDLCQYKVDGIAVSAVNKDINLLKEYIEKHYEPQASLIDKDILSSDRQIALLKESRNNLNEIKENAQNVPLDLLNENLRESYRCLCDILGKEYRDDLIDHLFANFCLGK